MTAELGLTMIAVPKLLPNMRWTMGDEHLTSKLGRRLPAAWWSRLDRIGTYLVVLLAERPDIELPHGSSSLSVDDPSRTHQWRWRALIVMTISVPLAFLAIATAPGLYSIDSIGQLGQARSGVFSDWHPPLMAGLWRILIVLTGSVSSLYWFHLTLLSLGLLLWGCAFRGARLGASLILLAIMASSPFWLNFAGVVWKDVGQALALFVAFGIVAVSRVCRCSRLWVFAIVPLAFYAIGVRHNGPPAVVPLLFLAIWPLVQGQGLRRIGVAICATIVCSGLLFSATIWVSYGILGATRQHTEQDIELYDLAGIAVRTGKDRFPQWAKTNKFDLKLLAGAYLPSASVPLSLGDAAQLKYSSQDNPAHMAELRAAWLRAIFDSPWAYIEHRTAVFLSLLRVGQKNPFYHYVDLAESNSLLKEHGIDSVSLPGNGRAWDILISLIRWAANNTVVFTGWFWLAVLVVVTSLGFGLRRSPLSAVAGALGLSGLLYVLPYYFITPTSDFRYLYWGVIAGSVGVAIVVGDLINWIGKERRHR